MTIPCLLNYRRGALELTPTTDQTWSLALPKRLPGTLAKKLLSAADRGQRWVDLTPGEIAAFRAANQSLSADGW